MPVMRHNVMAGAVLVSCLFALSEERWRLTGAAQLLP